MNIIVTELFRKLCELNYSMGTGSDEWQDLKTDYELEDDSLAGIMSFVERFVVDKDKIIKLISRLENFKVRVINYSPIDLIEIKEKAIMQEKINLGLDIYQKVLDTLK